MLYPLRFFPIYQTAIWGGGAFFRQWGREHGNYEQIAESWEISGHRNGISIVADGPLKGKSLQELVADYGKELLGKHAAQVDFPLFVKILDARQALSVQVHPGQEIVQKLRLPDKEKAEAWVILHAEPESRISLGFKWPVTRKMVTEMVSAGRLEEVLHTFEPRVGDCFFIPPGMVHSMGAGVTAYEIQTCSDLTLRLYDWNRRDHLGRSRELHLEQAVPACDVLRWQVGAVTPRRETDFPAVERLLCTEYFHLDRWNVKPESSGKIGGDSRCHVLTFLSGTASVDGVFGPLSAGETLLVPACLPEVEVRGEAVFLDAYLPG